MQDKRPLNEQNQAHGYWEVYYDTNKLWYKRNYINGVLFGYYEYFYGLKRENANKIYYAK